MIFVKLKSDNMLNKIPILETISLDEYTDFKIFDNKYGGMGIVSIGAISFENNDSEKLLAMKRIKVYNNIDIEKFKNEANLWITLKHPNIVKASSLMNINDEFCLFMEPILPNEKGHTTLNDYFDESLSVKQILDWSIQFCHAMIYSQSQGVVIHRDIKPDNILISNNLLKVTDFGIASAFNIVNDDRIRLTGTFEYQAPESFLGKYDVQSDIYSWGIVLYQMLMKGKLPYSITQMNFKSYDEKVEYFKNLHKSFPLPEVESPLNDIIRKCLEKNPSNRYDNFKEILCDLKRLYVELYDDEPYEPKLELFTDKENILKAYSLNVLGKKREAWDLINSIRENSETRPLLSFVFNQLGDPQKSLECYEREVLENPLNYESRYGYATRLHETGDYLEAEVQYNYTLKLKPNDKKTLVNLGNLIRDMGAYEEALEYYNEVLELDSDFFMAKFNKAINYIFMNKIKQSELLFDQIKMDKLYTKEFKICRANALTKDYEAKASTLFYELKEEYPNDKDVLLEIANFHREHQRYEACIDELKNILKFNEDNEYIKHLIALNYGFLADREVNEDNFHKSLYYINESLSYEDNDISWIKKFIILYAIKLYTNEDVSIEFNDTVENIKKHKNVLNIIETEVYDFSEKSFEENPILIELFNILNS